MAVLPVGTESLAVGEHVEVDFQEIGTFEGVVVGAEAAAEGAADVFFECDGTTATVVKGTHRYRKVVPKPTEEHKEEPAAAAAPASGKTEETDHEFVVEAVIDSRPAGSTVEYLVKWAGFSSSDNTWEPEANLQGCEKLLEYKAQMRRPRNHRSSGPERSVAPRPKKAKRAERPQGSMPRQHATEQPVDLVVGSLVDVDRRQARDGGAAKILSDLGVSYKVRYLCGGTERVDKNAVRPLAVGSPREDQDDEQEQSTDAMEAAAQEAPVMLTVTAGRAKRKRKSTTMTIDGQTVLKLNNYTLEDGEPTLTGRAPGDEPAKPKGARSAFALFSKDSHAAVAGLPFKDRAARLGELWRQATGEIRSKYEALAAKDRARFARELAAYNVACENHAAEVAAAKKSAEQAEWQSLQNDDALRKQIAAERKAKRASKPATKRQVSSLEKARLAHNAAVDSDRDKALESRKAFVRKHTECLRPFVPADVLKRMCSTGEPAARGRGRRASGTSTKSKLAGASAASTPSLTTGAGVSATPSWIKGEMRDYQLEGVSWLLDTYDSGISAILGDEMGLGKTLQTIAFLSSLMKLRNVSGPFLVVAPLSVLSSWMTEFRKFCPTMRVQKLHSSDPGERERIRKTILPDIASYDVVVTTYEMVKTTMHSALARIHWRYLVIDEGHVIKNEETQLSVALRKIKFAQALILTGTPLQNNMHELWALLNFLYPDIFTSSAAFDSAFKIGGSDQNVDDDMLTKAHFMLRPFMLRRVKADVEKTVPPKEEIKVFCPLSGMQKFWYKSLLLRQASSLTKGSLAVAKADGEAGEGDENTENVGKGTYLQLNNLLMQLRKVCCHPFLFPGTEDDPDVTPLEELVEASGKLCVLEKLLHKLQAAGHRVCLFSQFTSVLNILEDFVRLKEFAYCRLDGSTNRVQRTVDISSFNAPDSPYFLFLMSTRAGGLGINLQTADTCILFDSDWNPQGDLQAMARVHRIGQKKVVHVYRLITRGTVEERMIQRAEKKLYLDSMVNRGSTKNGQKLEKLGTKALMEMLTFGADKIMSADEDKLPSDEDIELLIDRSPAAVAVNGPSSSAGKKKVSRHGPLEIGTTQTAADFNAELPLLMTQTLQGETIVPSTLKDIGREWSKTQGKRKQKSRLKKIGKDSVLHINDYDLGDNLSVFDKEQAGHNMAIVKPTGRQIAGRDYDNEDHCLACWNGGDLVMCDFCPASFHPACLGFKDAEELTRGHKMGFSCPHHQCGVCGRKAAAAGGLLFRCSVCPSAFCEDHLPTDTPVVNRNARFLALGQRHPSQACFVLCSDECVQHSKTAEVKELENGACQAVIAGASAGILAGTTNAQAINNAARPVGGTASAAPTASKNTASSILPGRIATNYPSHLYHTVRVLVPANWKWSQQRPMCRLTLDDSSEHFYQLPENAQPGRSYLAHLPKQYNATTLSTLQEPELRMWLAANCSDADVLDKLRNAEERSQCSISAETLVPLAVATADAFGTALDSGLELDAVEPDASARSEEERPSRRKRRAVATVDSYDVDHLAETNNDSWCERVNGRFNTGERSSNGHQTQQQQQEEDTYVHPELISLDWDKHYDPGKEEFYWWNKTTYESSWDAPAATLTQPVQLPEREALDALVRAEVERNNASRRVQKQLMIAFHRGCSTTQRELRSKLVDLAPSFWRGWVDGTARVPHKYVSLIQTWRLSAADAMEAHKPDSAKKKQKQTQSYGCDGDNNQDDKDETFQPEDVSEEENMCETDQKQEENPARAASPIWSPTNDQPNKLSPRPAPSTMDEAPSRAQPFVRIRLTPEQLARQQEWLALHNSDAMPRSKGSDVQLPPMLREMDSHKQDSAKKDQEENSAGDEQEENPARAASLAASPIWSPTNDQPNKLSPRPAPSTMDEAPSRAQQRNAFVRIRLTPEQLARQQEWLAFRNEFLAS